MALVETCFKRVTGVFGDYSEQQFVDCGYGQNGANGCDGAAPHAYVKWSKDSAMGLFHESTYPYKNTAPTYSCPADLRKIFSCECVVSLSVHIYLCMSVIKTNNTIRLIIKSYKESSIGVNKEIERVIEGYPQSTLIL